MKSNPAVDRYIAGDVTHNDCTSQTVPRHLIVVCCCWYAQQLVLLEADDLEATLAQNEVIEKLFNHVNGVEELESV